MKETMRLGGLFTVITAGVLLANVASAQTDNTAYGTSALLSNQTGDDNTAVGRSALRDNTTGSDNSALGRGALYKNTSGFVNTAVGNAALYNNTTGTANTAVGDKALVSNEGGYNNVGIGWEALYSNQSGAWNVAIGTGALYANKAGNNTAVGNDALSNTTTGSSNAALGSSALTKNTTGIENVAVGGGASFWSATGQRNTALGNRALYWNATGSYNSAVGFFAGPSLDNLTNTGAFGASAVPTASNTIRIGNDAISWIGGIVTWSNLSDARFKTNVRENVPGLDFIRQLRPVTFKWDVRKLEEFSGAPRQGDQAMEQAMNEKGRRSYTGFLAQEVEAAAAQCDYDFSGVIRPENERSQYQLSYAEFVVPLVKAVQEQQREIEALRAAVTSLKTSDNVAASAISWSSVLGTSSNAALLGACVLLALQRVKRRKLS
jgi:trimeric autotransporter adhesin